MLITVQPTPSWQLSLAQLSPSLFLELSTFQIGFVNILRNQGGGGGVQKDHTITGGRGDPKGPKKGLRN